ncbi:MAG TPA: DNA-3-methyladenine glycosylase [Rhodothermales bacterium]|nr:DNA-3-methyladenine glycosylase [Rhodothermales bacterium]
MSLPYDFDAASATLAQTDPELARLIDQVKPLRLETRALGNPFVQLVRSITYQQLSTKAAGTIHGRMLALFPDSDHPSPEQILETPDETLRSAGLSRAKTRAIKDLAAKTVEGIVPTSEALTTMDNAAIIDRLTQVWGVGQWTVEMLLIFYLGRPDVLPVADLGVRKGFMIAYGLDDLPSPSELRDYGIRWQPYRSVASWYLWRANDL